MEILIGIAPILITVTAVYIIISIQEWIYRQETKKEIDRMLGEVEYTLSTGEMEELGPGKVFIFDKQKVGIVTSLPRNEELDEAERLIKEAKEKQV